MKKNKNSKVYSNIEYNSKKNVPRKGTDEYKKELKKEEEKTNKNIEILNNSKAKSNILRNSRIGKTTKELKEELEQNTNQKEEKKFDLSKFILTLVLIISIILIYFFFKYASIFGINLNLDGKSVTLDIVTNDDNIYDNYMDELLVYSNQQLFTYNKKGKLTWNYNLEQSFVPNIYVEDNYMIVSNNTSGYIYLFYQKKEILNKKIEGTINNIYIDEYGNFAVEYSTSGYKKVIATFDKKGNCLSEIYLDSDAIINIQILGNANKLILTKVISTSYNAGTKILSFDLTSSSQDSKDIYTIENDIVFNVLRTDNKINFITSSAIYTFNIQTNEFKKIKEFEKSQLLFYDISDTYYSVVYKSLDQEESNSYYFDTSSYLNESISSNNIETSPMMVKSMGYLSYLVYQNNVKIYNKWGIKIKEINIKLYPKNIVLFNNGKTVALIYSNKIDVVNI